MHIQIQDRNKLASLGSVWADAQTVHLGVPEADSGVAGNAVYESLFGHAVGRADSLAAVAERMDPQHLKGIAACRTAFTRSIRYL